MKLFLLRSAILFATRRAAPYRIRTSGRGIQRENCYSIYISPSKNDQLDFLVEEIVDEGVIGAVTENNEFTVPACISNRDLRQSHLVVHHFFRGQRTRFNGLRDFIWGTISFHSRRYYWTQNFQQRLFNQRVQFRTDRIELLKCLVDFKLKKTEDIYYMIDSIDFDSDFDLFSDLYGYRIYEHPHYDREYRRFQMLLDSLKASGDISIQEGKIKVLGKSLSTISDFELEERRHNDLVFLQRVISILTAVLAGATILQLID